MNQREKMLAILVGVLLGGIGLYLCVTTVMGWFSSRREQIKRLDTEIARKDGDLRRGAKAERRQRGYEERALPPNRELSLSEYQDWLMDSFVDAGWKHEVNLKGLIAQKSRQERDIYTVHSYLVTAQVNLDQFTRWMHGFYSANHLHRLRNCTLQPIKGSKDLTVTLTVEAMSLPGSDNVNTLGQGQSERLESSLDDYLNDIVGRNLFAPANRPPSLASSDRKQGHKGQPLRFTVKADDPDKNPADKVSYAITDGAPEGARLNASSGEFSWTPKENGEFVVLVTAADDGLPSKSAQQKITIKVTDPPDPPPVVARKLDFDDAKYTFLTGIIRNGEYSTAWFTIRPTGQTLKLREGAKIKVGSIDGKVAEIAQDDVTLETTDGKRLLVTRGENLLQAQNVGSSTSVTRTPE